MIFMLAPSGSCGISPRMRGFSRRRGMIHHSGGERRILSLETGRENDVISPENRSARETVDDNVDAAGANIQIEQDDLHRLPSKLKITLRHFAAAT
jgi:hypothetical protein